MRSEALLSQIKANLLNNSAILGIFNIIYAPPSPVKKTVGSVRANYSDSILSQIQHLHELRSSLQNTLQRCDTYLSDIDARPDELDLLSINAAQEWLWLHIDRIARFYSEQVCGLYRAYSTENLKDPAKTVLDAWRDANFRHQDIPLSYSAWCVQGNINEQMATNGEASVSFFERYLQQPARITHVPFVNFITNYFNQGGIYALETFIKSWGVPVEIMSAFSRNGTTFFKQIQLVNGTPVLQIKRDIHIIPNYMTHLTSGKLVNDPETGYPGPFCFVLTLNCEVTQATEHAPISFANGEFNLQIITNPTYPIADPQNEMMPDHIVTLIEYAIDYANDIATKAAQPLADFQLAAASAVPTTPPRKTHWARSSVITQKFGVFRQKILGVAAPAHAEHLRAKLLFFSLTKDYDEVCRIVVPYLKSQLASGRGIYYQENGLHLPIISIEAKKAEFSVDTYDNNAEKLRLELDSVTCLMSPSAIGKHVLYYPILTRSRIKSEADFKLLTLIRSGHEKKLSELAAVTACLSEGGLEDTVQVLQVEVLVHCTKSQVIDLLNTLNLTLATYDIQVKLKYNHPSPLPSVRCTVAPRALAFVTGEDDENDEGAAAHPRTSTPTLLAPRPPSPCYSPIRPIATGRPMHSPAPGYYHAAALQQRIREIVDDRVFCININWFHKTVTPMAPLPPCHFETQIENTRTLTALKILLEETYRLIKNDGFSQQAIPVTSADMAKAAIRENFRASELPKITYYLDNIIRILRESEA